MLSLYMMNRDASAYLFVEYLFKLDGIQFFHLSYCEEFEMNCLSLWSALLFLPCMINKDLIVPNSNYSQYMVLFMISKDTF